MKGLLTMQMAVGVLLVGLVLVFVDAARASTSVGYSEMFNIATADLNGKETSVGFGNWEVHDGGAYVTNGALYSTGTSMNVSFDLPASGNNLVGITYAIKARAYSSDSGARALFGLSEVAATDPFNHLVLGGNQRADTYLFSAIGGPGATVDQTGWINTYFRVPQAETATWIFSFDITNNSMTASIQSEGRALKDIWTNKVPQNVVTGENIGRFWIQFNDIDPTQSFIDEVSVSVELDSESYPIGAETNCIEWVANFEQGVDETWDFEGGVFIPRCWVDGVAPGYSYVHADTNGSPAYWNRINDNSSSDVFTANIYRGSPVEIGSIGWDVPGGTNAVLSWWGQEGQSYGVRTKTNLDDGSWQPASNNILGQGGMVSSTNEITTESGFYNVYSENPFGEGINWWHTLQAQTNNGVSYANYRLFMPEVTNHMDWRGFDRLRVDWMGANFTQADGLVNMEISAWSASNSWVNLGYREQLDGVRVVDEYDLATLSEEELSAVGYLQFKTLSWHLPLGNDYAQAQRTHLFGVQLVDDEPYSVTNSAGGGALDQRSSYLGTMLYRRYGSYSAHGFWDPTVDKYRIWFGGGIPELPSNDNVWYVETASLEPGIHMPDPRRCTLESFDILKPGDDSGIPQYGGDPSVLKFEGEGDGSDLYVMFFSGLKMRVGPQWNEVYRAVSDNGIDWVLNPTNPVVPAATGGTAGYGSGAPSVAKVGDLYYMYYYSQYENTNAPGLYRRTSVDEISWSVAEPAYAYDGNVLSSGGQVTFIPNLNKWMVLLSEYNLQIGTSGIKAAYSDDGLNFTIPVPIAQRRYFLSGGGGHNHNPGFIGDRMGRGFPDMYITYGISETEVNKYEYTVRQLGYSSLHITPK